MKALRRIALIGGVVLLGALALGAWLLYDFNEANRTDVWNRDGPPNSAMMKRLTDSAFPPSITRVVENGVSSRANGDGEELTIYCFPLSDLQGMKKALGGGGTWDVGFPTDMNWRYQIESRAPADLMIGRTASPDAFIHVHIPAEEAAMNSRWTIIDTDRGISYRIVIRT